MSPAPRKRALDGAGKASASDGLVRGSWPRRRPEVDPAPHAAASRRRPGCGAAARQCPPYHFGEQPKKSGILRKVGR